MIEKAKEKAKEIKNNIGAKVEEAAKENLTKKLSKIEDKILKAVDKRMDTIEKNLKNAAIKQQHEAEVKVKAQLRNMEAVIIKLVEDLEKENKTMIKKEINKRLKNGR
jgi:hypothetical protein